MMRKGREKRGESREEEDEEEGRERRRKRGRLGREREEEGRGGGSKVATWKHGKRKRKRESLIGGNYEAQDYNWSNDGTRANMQYTALLEGNQGLTGS